MKHLLFVKIASVFVVLKFAPIFTHKCNLRWGNWALPAINNADWAVWDGRACLIDLLLFLWSWHNSIKNNALQNTLKTAHLKYLNYVCCVLSLQSHFSPFPFQKLSVLARLYVEMESSKYKQLFTKVLL